MMSLHFCVTKASDDKSNEKRHGWQAKFFASYQCALVIKVILNLLKVASLYSKLMSLIFFSDNKSTLEVISTNQKETFCS